MQSLRIIHEFATFLPVRSKYASGYCLAFVLSCLIRANVSLDFQRFHDRRALYLEDHIFLASVTARMHFLDGKINSVLPQLYVEKWSKND